MSLLANLLSFSSLAQSTDKQPRSASLGTRFLFEDNSPKDRDRLQRQQKRTESKSLTKMNLFSVLNTKVDPKQKCLHKLVHRLGIKVRKHYYSLFVILQTMKKNKVSLQKTTKQIDTDKIVAGTNRLRQTLQIIEYKYFQQKIKSGCFIKIRNYSRLAKITPAIHKLQFSCNRFILRANFKKLITILKQAEALDLKVQIFTDTLSAILNRINQNSQKQIHEAFNGIKLLATKVRKQQNDQTQITQEWNEETKTQPNIEKQSMKKVKTEEEQSSFDQNSIITPIKRNNRIKSQQNSPTKAAGKSISLKKAVFEQNIDSICQNISKTYKIQTNFQEQPIQFDETYQAVSRVIQKQLPQHLGTQQIGDLQDISRIFREKTSQEKNSSKFSKNDKSQLVSGIQYEDFSDAVSESFFRIQNMINDMEKNREKKSSRSDSLNTSVFNEEQNFNKKYKTNDSLFSSDAVSFKNSLVNERESINKMDRQRVSFLKKKNSHFNSKGAVYEKNLLREEAEKGEKSDSNSKPLRKNPVRRISFQEEYLYEEKTPIMKKIETQNFVQADRSPREKSNKIADTPFSSRNYHFSADKSKQFTFKPHQESNNQEYWSRDKITREFEQKSDEGIMKNIFFKDTALWQPFEQGFKFNGSKISLDNRNLTYSSQKDIPVKDISLNQKMNRPSILGSMFNKEEKQSGKLSSNLKAIKNKSSNHQLYQTEVVRKEVNGAPKKFINLVRK